MKVLNLQCAVQHGFEGWVASEEEFQSQLARGLVACPVCGDTSVHKLPSAPRLNLRAGGSEPAREVQAVETIEPQAAPQAAWLQAVRQVMANTEDVGARFADEARKIHYGESATRNIRGQASAEETEALLDEGIAVLPLPVPPGLKEPLQ